jgi:RNA polymerase sigma-70 factor (ECF subfamily)
MILLKSIKEDLCIDATYMDSIIKLYYHSIFRVAYIFVKNKHDSEDITQETFLELLKNNQPFGSKEHEKAWLVRVAINKSKNFLNSYWNRNTEALREDIPFKFTKKEFDLFDAISSLDGKYKTVIHLFYFEKYTIPEIANILDSNSSSVNTLLIRGRKKIKRKLGDDYDDKKIIYPYDE